MMDKRDAQFWLEYCYPTTIIKDRYNGAYSGAKWLAFPMDYYQVPKDIDSVDIECMMFWESYAECVGKGNTIEEAFSDLVVKMKEVMIHEEIVTFEVAKLAKEKGFPQHIGDDAYIVENEYDDEYEVGCHYPIQFIPDYLPTITAPTQSLLQRFLREEKGIHIGIGTDGGNDWRYITVVIATGHTEYNTNIFPTYEQALEGALKYTLEKLV